MKKHFIILLLAVLFLPIKLFAAEHITKIEVNYTHEFEYSDALSGNDTRRATRYSVPEGVNYSIGNNNIWAYQCPSEENCNGHDITGMYDQRMVAGRYTYLVFEIYANRFGNEVQNPEYDFDEANLDEIELLINGETLEGAFIAGYNDSWREVDVYVPITITEYTGIKHTVSFNTNGGSAIENQEIAEGFYATKPEKPTKENQVFNGWFEDPELTKPFNFNSTKIMQDTTIYAAWRDKVVTENINKIEINYTSKTVFLDSLSGNALKKSLTYSVPDGVNYSKGNNNIWIRQCPSEGDCESNEMVGMYEQKLVAGRETRVIFEIYANPFGNEVDNPTHDFDKDNLDKIEVWINGEKRDDVIVEGYNGSWREVDVIVPITISHDEEHEVKNITLAGVPDLIDGEVPSVNTITTITPGLSINNAKWYEDTRTWFEDGEATQFVAGKRYILVAVLDAEEGYSLADDYNENQIVTNITHLKGEYVKEGPDVRIYFEAKAKEIPAITSTPILKVANGIDNTLDLSWTGVANAAGFKVLRSESKKGKYKQVADETANSYTDTGLTYGKTYYYKVIAYNEKSSKTSSIISNKTVPNKVTGLTVTSVGSTSIKVSWNKENVSGYEVYVGGKKATTISKNGTFSYNKTKLKANTTYKFKVRAYKKVGSKKIYGPFSSEMTIKTSPATPSISVSNKDYKSLSVKLNSAKGAVNYMLEKSTDNKIFELVQELPSSGTLVISDLEVGKTYYFRLKVCNDDGNCSSYSKTVSKKVVPSVPTNIKKQLGVYFINLLWDEVESADGFEIYRSTKKSSGYKNVGTSLVSSFNNTKLSSAKTYYYKIRSYKLVDGKKVYSDFSSVITAKTNKITKSQKKAVDRAKSYLKVLSFSYNGLIEQLEFEKYSASDAKFAVDNCGANWNEQAIKTAKSYLKTLSFSYESLVEQLEFEKFTHEQAVYGVNNSGADWNAEALECARSYLRIFDFDESEMISQLQFEKFTDSQINYAINVLYH